MLLDKMTPDEITSEIFTDYANIKNSLIRIGQQYERERKKLKIDNKKIYAKPYQIKSAKKNNWIFILSKAPAVEKYKGVSDMNVCCLVYYYTSIGIRVFKIIPTGGLNVYNDHIFTRYNEQLGLRIKESIEIVKHFFSKNGYSHPKIVSKENEEFVISICREGLLLGEFQEGKKWLVNKTFITRDLSTVSQEEVETELLASLQKEIEDEINNPSWDIESYNYKVDVLMGIR